MEFKKNLNPHPAISFQSLSFTAFALFCFSCTYHKAEEVKPELLNVSYAAEIQPIIEAHCYNCHSENATDPDRPGYAFLDEYESLKRYALKPSVSNANYTTLQARIRFIEYPGMPFQQDPLPESDIQKIETWIKLGAPNN